MMKKETVLILPGYGNSSPEHWQSLWEEKNPHFIRVTQNDWHNPICEEWVQSLAKELAKAQGDVYVVAHSMACLAVAHMASQKHRAICGALLVGVPDPKASFFPSSAKGFEQTPLVPFDFPSIVVASQNDLYASFPYAKSIAKAWGSTLVDIGEQGHINAQSGLGFWDEGWTLFESLKRKA